MSRTAAAIALFRSCHPLPSAAVTATGVVLTAAAGNSVRVCVLAGVALLAGQLSVGWSNDRIDVERDRRVEHEGKPLAAGAISLRVVDLAIVVAVVATVVLSLLLGWRAGLLHLGAVAAAWAYNAKLKGTLISWLPYAVAFGALPAVATQCLPTHPWPFAWLTVAAALIGTAVNFVNAKQQLADDPRSDVHALPDRIGGPASLCVAAVLLAASGVLVTLGPAGAPSVASWICAVGTAVLLVVGLVVLWPHAASRRPFYGLIVLVPLQLLVVVITARPLH